MYGLWTPVGAPFYKYPGKKFLRCRCRCGYEADIDFRTLVAGTSSGCRRCRAVTAMNNANTTHGMSGNRHPLYPIWKSMKQRCLNPKNCRYPDYGGRGITVCSEWIQSFPSFYNWCIANGWRQGLHLDRADNNGGYSPDNCHFVTPIQNCHNSRPRRKRP